MMTKKDVCLKCGVEIFDGGTWGYCAPCGEEEFLAWHEREHVKVRRLAKLKRAKWNEARDYMEPTIQEFMQSEMKKRQQETEEFMYKELLRFMQSRQKAIHELDEFFNQEIDG